MPKLWRFGHLVIPKALREAHDIHPGDPVEIFERDGGIVIRKVSATVKPHQEQRKS
jgi:AbrB family looped-hinge helix DNA binding protein